VLQTAKNGNEGVNELQYFIQELGTRMTSWQATTFLIGEYVNLESEANPVMTVADGMIALSNDIDGNTAVRKIRVVKMRGQAHLAGAHTFRIGDDGLQIYPRLLPPLHAGGKTPSPGARLASGVDGLDDLLGGGLPRGHALLVVGPSGSGKTVLATQFLAAGVAAGEKGVLACFEKGAVRLRNADVARLVNSGDVALVSSRSLDLSIEEILDDVIQAVRRTGATRVVIDSLSEVGLYLAPEFRDDLRASVFRLLAGLAELGVTVVVTMGMDDSYTELRFSKADTGFLADAIVAMRYVEVAGALVKVLSVVKVRGSAHSADLRRYDIRADGIHIAPAPLPYSGLLSGHPTATAGTQ